MLLVVPATLVWLFVAQVSVYEVSSSARIEVLTMPQSVAAEVEGRVVASKLHIGLETLAGDVLVTLDDKNIRQSIDELNHQIETDRSQLAEIRKGIEARRQSLVAQANARVIALQESQSQQKAAETRNQFATQNLQRVSKLAAQNAASTEELEKSRAEAETAQALLEAAQFNVNRTEQDRLADEQRQEAELATIQRDAAQTEGAVAVHEATLRRLEHELTLRSIQARVAGRVEEVVPIRVGSVVRPSEKLATIVPPGEPRIVALLPVVAVGRIVAGQPARLRLDGFPWTQYGTIAATVTGVGNEPTDGLIRVELSVTVDSKSRIHPQHGQTGSVEIEVERASPAMLILRAAGETLMTQRTSTGIQ